MDGPKPEIVLLESEKSVEDQLRAISQITRRLERVPSLEGRFKFRVRNQMNDMERFFMDAGLFTQKKMTRDGWGLLVMNVRKR
ncbi:MAG: hypothetical protein JRJ82_05270 [Deltaproteobacteria bacterium]|nr:hypothetical protein [Deltaproteobacteria bacterium]